MIAIELNQVSKITQGKRLLKQISFKIEEGIIYGLIGSDHSRKSLLIKLMVGLVKASEGYVQYFNKVFKQHMLKDIGVVNSDISFYDDMTARENIEYYLETYAIRLDEDTSALIETYFKKFDLFSDLDMPVGKYSLGMLQKLRLIRAMIIQPKILILDEPAKSLDPISIMSLKQELSKLSGQGVTIFIVTSMLPFISDLADRIGLLHYGELVEEIDLDDHLKKRKDYLEIESMELPKLILVIERHLSIFDYEVIDDNIIHIYSDYENSHIINTLYKHQIPIQQFKNGIVSLEEFFLKKIGD